VSWRGSHKTINLSYLRLKKDLVAVNLAVKLAVELQDDEGCRPVCWGSHKEIPSSATGCIRTIHLKSKSVPAQLETPSDIDATYYRPVSFVLFLSVRHDRFTSRANLSLAVANSDIFPALPAAENSVAWKDGYFWINGKPTFLTSGEMHYARIPRELWRDRIWRAKEWRFNCIQTYVFWNAERGARRPVGFFGQP